MRFAELCPQLEIHYDTNNFKGIPAWGYEFPLSRGAKDCLAMISESNHLNEWTLGKGKQKTNCIKKKRNQKQQSGLKSPPHALTCLKSPPHALT